MVTRKADVDGCPVDACDSEVTVALVTTDGTKLKKQNFIHDGLCLHPTTFEDEPAAYIIYHTEIEAVEAADESEADDEEAAEPAPDADGLEGDHLVVYRRIQEATANGGTIKLGEVKGKCLSADIPPGVVGDIASELVDDGYVEESSDAVLRVAE